MLAGAGSVRSSAGHVDRLHGRDRAGAGRGDALLQLAHLGGQRRLVADGARHAAEERRHLRACLHEAEDVVDEQQHVLALLAEVLRHREAGQRDAETGSGRLVHLAVDERDLVEHAGLFHLEVEVVALARALADTGEHGHAAVGVGDVVDELHDRDGLADAGTTEETDLAALDVRRDQVDHLDARLEDLDGRLQVAECRRLTVDRPPLDALDRGLVVDRLADHVPDASERRVANGNRDRPARVDDVRPTRETVGGIHGDRAHAVVAEVLLHLRNERRGRPVGSVDLDLDGVEDLGQAVREDRVDHDALDLDDLAGVGTVLAGHGSPESSLSVHGVSARDCRTCHAKCEPATCVKKCRSGARQAAVAYRIPALPAHENGRSALVPARPQRGRHGRVLSTVRREADTRPSIVRAGGRTLRPRGRHRRVIVIVPLHSSVSTHWSNER